MAYQVDYTDPLTGVPLPEAYFRVRNVMVDHGAKLAVIQLDIYATKALRDGGQQPFRSMPLPSPINPASRPFSRSLWVPLSRRLRRPHRRCRSPQIPPLTSLQRRRIWA